MSRAVKGRLLASLLGANEDEDGPGETGSARGTGQAETGSDEKPAEETPSLTSTSSSKNSRKLSRSFKRSPRNYGGYRSHGNNEDVLQEKYKELKELLADQFLEQGERITRDVLMQTRSTMRHLQRQAGDKVGHLDGIRGNRSPEVERRDVWSVGTETDRQPAPRPIVKSDVHPPTADVETSGELHVARKVKFAADESESRLSTSSTPSVDRDGEAIGTMEREIALRSLRTGRPKTAPVRRSGNSRGTIGNRNPLQPQNHVNHATTQAQQATNHRRAIVHVPRPQRTIGSSPDRPRSASSRPAASQSADRRPRASSDERKTDHRLSGTANPFIQAWLKRKTRDWRRGQREERKLERDKKKEEVAKEEQKEARKEESELQVKHWMRRKKQEARKLRKTEIRNAIRAEENMKLYQSTQKLKLHPREMLRHSVDGAESKPEVDESKMATSQSNEDLKCTCGYVELQSMTEAERSTFLLQKEREKQQALQQKLPPKLSRNTLVLSNEVAVRPSSGFPRRPRSAKLQAAANKDPKAAEKRDVDNRASYNNWLKKKREEEAKRKIAEKKREEEEAKRVDEGMKTIVKQAAKRRLAVLDKQKRFASGVGSEPVYAKEGEDKDEAKPEQTDSGGKSGETVKPDVTGGRYQWGKQRPNSAANSSPPRSRPMSPFGPSPRRLVTANGAYQRVRHSRESWEDFSQHMWDELHKAEYGDERPEPQGSDHPSADQSVAKASPVDDAVVMARPVDDAVAMASPAVKTETASVDNERTRAESVEDVAKEKPVSNSVAMESPVEDDVVKEMPFDNAVAKVESVKDDVAKENPVDNGVLKAVPVDQIIIDGESDLKTGKSTPHSAADAAEAVRPAGTEADSGAKAGDSPPDQSCIDAASHDYGIDLDPENKKTSCETEGNTIEMEKGDQLEDYDKSVTTGNTRASEETRPETALTKSVTFRDPLEETVIEPDEVMEEYEEDIENEQEKEEEEEDQEEVEEEIESVDKIDGVSNDAKAEINNNNKEESDDEF